MKVQMRKHRRFETFKGFPFKEKEIESNGHTDCIGTDSPDRVGAGTDQGKVVIGIGYISKTEDKIGRLLDKFKEVAQEKPVGVSTLTPRMRAALRYSLKYHANVYRALEESEKNERA